MVAWPDLDWVHGSGWRRQFDDAVALTDRVLSEGAAEREKAGLPPLVQDPMRKVLR